MPLITKTIEVDILYQWFSIRFGKFPLFSLPKNIFPPSLDQLASLRNANKKWMQNLVCRYWENRLILILNLYLFLLCCFLITSTKTTILISVFYLVLNFIHNNATICLKCIHGICMDQNKKQMSIKRCLHGSKFKNIWA